MFKRLFGRKPVADDRDTAPAPDENQMKAAAMDHALEEARKTDRIVPLRVGAQELVQMLLNAMKDGRGVHVESLLVTLGSLAGFCCVDSTLKQIALMGKTSREVGIIDVGMSNGQRYYLGDPINNLLAESDHSLWALVAGAANQLGTQDYPDFADIAKHVAGTLGGDQFGIPRVLDKSQYSNLPIDCVRDIWPAILPHLERRAPDLRERVLLLGLAVQQVMEMGKDAIDPALAGKIVMECAVPMAKLDPAALWSDRP